MKVVIDPYAGFCYGVERAIDKAESALKQHKSLYCLGELVHNPKESIRLAELGLTNLDHEQFHNQKNRSVLIRAHGEPPETYDKANRNNHQLVDATCPIVQKLQERIRRASTEMKTIGGTVVIAGKKNHPEVIGLLGQTDGQAIVLETTEDLDRINYNAPIRVFTQTTLDPEQFFVLAEKIKERVEKNGQDKDQLKIYNTICGHVKNRIPQLKSFCSGYDVILFVSGRESSNGRAMFRICKQTNPSSYFITGPEELNKQWFQNKSSVGISGATSTPAWLLQAVAEKLKE